MKRREKIPRKNSRIEFKRKTGVHKVNSMNPRGMRGGIRL